MAVTTNINGSMYTGKKFSSLDSADENNITSTEFITITNTGGGSISNTKISYNTLEKKLNTIYLKNSTTANNDIKGIVKGSTDSTPTFNVSNYSNNSIVTYAANGVLNAYAKYAQPDVPGVIKTAIQKSDITMSENNIPKYGIILNSYIDDTDAKLKVYAPYGNTDTSINPELTNAGLVVGDTHDNLTNLNKTNGDYVKLTTHIKNGVLRAFAKKADDNNYGVVQTSISEDDVVTIIHSNVNSLSTYVETVSDNKKLKTVFDTLSVVQYTVQLCAETDDDCTFKDQSNNIYIDLSTLTDNLPIWTFRPNDADNINASLKYGDGNSYYYHPVSILSVSGGIAYKTKIAENSIRTLDTQVAFRSKNGNFDQIYIGDNELPAIQIENINLIGQIVKITLKHIASTTTTTVLRTLHITCLGVKSPLPIPSA